MHSIYSNFFPLTDVRSPALAEALFYNKKDDNNNSIKFPVVIFSHGLNAHRSVYSSICCDLASHGYIVAAIEHKDRSACLTFNRIPGPGVPDGDYDRYINEWITVSVGPKEDFPVRNNQVMLNKLMSTCSNLLDL